MKPSAVIALVLMAALLSLVAVAALAEEQDQQAVCTAQGGCAIVTAAWLRAQLQRAFNDGFSSGSSRCLRLTT